MKYFRLFYSVLLIAFLGLSSCTPIEDCGSCEVVTYDLNDGHEIHRESAIEYCGASLDEKENTDPVINGNEKIVWECY